MEGELRTAFDGLSAAVAQAEGIGEYYNELPSTLESINMQLQGISGRIQRLLDKLHDKTTRLVANQAIIDDLTGQHGNMSTRLAESQTEIDRITRESDDIRRQIQELTQDRNRERSEQETHLRELVESHQKNLEDQRNANSEEKRRQLEEIDARNQAEQDALRASMADAQNASQRQLAELTERARLLEQRANASETEVSNINASRQELAANIQRLELENANLKSQISEVTEVMKQATTILENLTPDRRDQIERQIRELNTHIDRIKSILDSEPNDDEPNDDEYSETRQHPPINNDDTINLPNGRNITISELINKLNEKIRQVERNRADASKYTNFRNIITRDKSGNYGIQDIQNMLNRFEFTENEKFKGGKKTRKHKKYNRKTKKQRGGYKYKFNAVRSSIATSRISRRSRRRSSSKTTRTTRTSSR